MEKRSTVGGCAPNVRRSITDRWRNKPVQNGIKECPDLEKAVLQSVEASDIQERGKGESK